MSSIQYLAIASLLLVPDSSARPGQEDPVEGAAILRSFDPTSVPEMASAAEIFAELADLNEDGIVTLHAYRVFNGHLGPIGVPGNEALTTELVFQGLNQDGLTDWTKRDLEGTFERLRGEFGDDIVIADVDLETLCAGDNGTRGLIRRIASELILEEADRDEDGVVTPTERFWLVKEWGVGGHPLANVSTWIERAKGREPEDRNRMSPGVAFITFEVDMDHDGDGLFDQERFNEWHLALDANHDGELDVMERANRPRPEDELWRAPTAERWALPPLMPWQRSLEDALAVQKRTGQPLLIAVNMDGETACDSLAAWQYRDPEFAKLASGYVCIVLSPDDHNPREYDDRGRRVVSERLGRVIDPEHIDPEPMVFARYMTGRRVAPRHVGVAPDGTVLFDVLMINNPALLTAALRGHGQQVPIIDVASATGLDLTTYSDAAARVEVERRMLTGDDAARLDLAAHLGSQPDAGMIALRDPLLEVREAAALALAAAPELLRADQCLRLIQGAAGLSEEVRLKVASGLNLKARESVYVGTALGTLDPTAWVSRLGELDDWVSLASAANLSMLPIKSRDAALAVVESLDAKSEDPAVQLARSFALLDLASAFLDLMEDPRDAASEAIRAARQGASADPIRAQAVIACASFLTGDYEEAVKGSRVSLPSLWTAPSDPLYLATMRALRSSVLQIVYRDLAAGMVPPQSMLADAVLAGRTLLAHPAVKEGDATELMDLLAAANDSTVQPVVALAAASLFPYSAEVQQRFRYGVLQRAGAGGIAAAYDQVSGSLKDPSLDPSLRWFQGLAELVAAEWEMQQRGTDGAIEQYAASIATFDGVIEEEPPFAESANHYKVLCHAALASLLAERGNLGAAIEHLQTAATLRPVSLDLTDGLGLTPRQRAAQVLPLIDSVLGEDHRAAFARIFP